MELRVETGKLGAIGVPGCWIAVEVFAEAELGGVDVDAHDDLVVAAGGSFADEVGVAGMEGAHSGDECDALVCW